MVNHSGQVQNQLTLEEHDGLLNAKKVSLISGATIFAVVNTGAGSGPVTVKQGDNPWVSSLPSGATVYQGTTPWVNALPSGVTVYQGTQPWNSLGTVTPVGLHTLAPSPNFIGIVTITNQLPLVASAAFVGIVTVAGISTLTLSDPKGYIGLVTATLAGGNATITPFGQFLNQASLISLASGGYGPFSVDQFGRQVMGTGLANIGFASVNVGGIADSKGFIGLTTTTLGASPAFVGIVTVANQLPLVASAAFVGIVTITNQPPLTAGVANIGFVTVAGIGTVTLADPKGFIGLVTIGGISTLTLSDPKGFIGLVTAVIGNQSIATKNAGTTKTLQIFPIIISTGSAATVYVPTSKFYLTSLLLNSNSTVRVNVRSGATYLTGNASVGIELNPGSGFVEMGSPDSPAYIGLAAAAPIVIEKTDYSGVISRVSGKLVLFDE